MLYLKKYWKLYRFLIIEIINKSIRWNKKLGSQRDSKIGL